MPIPLDVQVLLTGSFSQRAQKTLIHAYRRRLKSLLGHPRTTFKKAREFVLPLPRLLLAIVIIIIVIIIVVVIIITITL